MEWTVIFRFLPLLIELAENIFGAKKGAEKKDYVINKALPEVAKGIGMMVTGGAKETWDAINANMGTISKAIDTTVSIFNDDPNRDQTM